MPILLAISILALVALLWASISIARHIRRARRTSPASAAIVLTELLEEAPLPEDVPQAFPTAQESAAGFPTQAVQATAPAQAVTPSPAEVGKADVVEIQALPPRKFPPVAATASRVDWAYFKEDMGDLTDPLPAHPKLRQRAR